MVFSALNWPYVGLEIPLIFRFLAVKLLTDQTISIWKQSFVWKKMLFYKGFHPILVCIVYNCDLLLWEKKKWIWWMKCTRQQRVWKELVFECIKRKTRLKKLPNECCYLATCNDSFMKPVILLFYMNSLNIIPFTLTLFLKIKMMILNVLG